MAKTSDAPDARLERELADLKKQYERLKEDKVRAEQDAAHLARQLAELEERARADYGTADPAELAALLNAKRQENAQLVANYKTHLDDITRALAAVEEDSPTP